MDNNTSSIFTFLYIFLVGTGIYSIILSLYKLTNPHKVIDPKSTLKTKLFKLSGPIGFIYGIFVILLVMFIVRTDNSNELKNELMQVKNQKDILQKENDYLKSIIGDSTLTEPSLFKMNVSRYNPSSLFGGKVLIQYESNTFSANELKFKGIKGVSLEEKGNYNKSKLEIEEGDKFYIKLISDTVYGVNVLDDVGGLTLEFYKIH